MGRRQFNILGLSGGDFERRPGVVISLEHPAIKTQVDRGAQRGIDREHAASRIGLVPAAMQRRIACTTLRRESFAMRQMVAVPAAQGWCLFLFCGQPEFRDELLSGIAQINAFSFASPERFFSDINRANTIEANQVEENLSGLRGAGIPTAGAIYGNNVCSHRPIHESSENSWIILCWLQTHFSSRC